MTKSSSQDISEQTKASELADLRAKIDEIDDALLSLLAKRQGLSRQIVTKKALGSNVFRPDREVSLLRALVETHPEIEARLIMGLWRHIISASIAEQKPDYTIAHSAGAAGLATHHGAGYMQLDLQASVEQAIASLQAGSADCVIVTEDEMRLHAHLLVPDEVVIAASIGFLFQEGQERGYVLCREMPLASGPNRGDDMIVVRGDDNSLTHHPAAHDALPSGVVVGHYATPLNRPIK